MSSDETIPKPKIGEAASSGASNPQASAYVNQIAQPGDRILRARGGGDLGLYEQVLSDPRVMSAFLQRRNAVQAREWRVEAGGDRRIDIKAADHLRKQLQRVSFDNLTDKMLFGVFYGYSAAEILWDVQDGKYGWRGIKVRNRRKFKFAGDGTLRRFSSTNVVDGVPALPPYYWHFVTGADNDDEPYGMGLAHWCYWPVLFKRQGIKFWLIYLDKFGMPTSHGQFPAGASDEEKRRLLQAGQAIATDTTVITPEGMTLDLIEASRSGTADYKVLHDTMNDTISQVIMGQTASSQGTPGRLGNDDLQGDVRLDIIKADADLVCESLNVGPVRWMTMFNWPDAEPPRVFRVIEEAEDADTLAARDTKVAALGFKPGISYIKEQYGDHWEPQSESGGAPGEPDGEAPPAFAEPAAITARRSDAQDKLDAILAGADQQSAGWRDFVEPRVNELLRLLDEGGDLKDFRERVVEFADDDPNAQFVEALARAGFGAQLLGRVPKEK